MRIVKRPRERGLPQTFPGLTGALVAPAAKAAAPSATGPIRLGLRFVYVQGATIQVGAVQGRDCFLSFRFVPHFHEAEPAGASRIAVGKNADPVHLAIRG